MISKGLLYSAPGSGIGGIIGTAPFRTETASGEPAARPPASRNAEGAIPAKRKCSASAAAANIAPSSTRACGGLGNGLVVGSPAFLSMFTMGQKPPLPLRVLAHVLNRQKGLFWGPNFVPWSVCPGQTLAHPLSASELIKKDKPDRQHCANVHAGLASDWMLLSSLTANPAPFSMAQKPPLALRVLGHVHCHRKGYLLMITLSFLPNEFPTASAPTLGEMLYDQQTYFTKFNRHALHF